MMLLLFILMVESLDSYGIYVQQRPACRGRSPLMASQALKWLKKER